MSDTPRTDSMMRVVEAMRPNVVVVNVEFARELERELAEAKARISQLELGYDELRTASNRKIEAAEQRCRELETALLAIRDATHKSAVVLRGIADNALKEGRE